jgi:hypothetical protein
MRHSNSWERGSERSDSFQVRVFCLGLFQDWDVGVGVFAEGEEIPVSGASFCGIALQCIPGTVNRAIGLRDRSPRGCQKEWQNPPRCSH